MQRYAAQTLSRAHATAVGLRKERPVAGSAPARHRAARRTRPLKAAASERPASKTKPPPPITLTETALEHLKKLRQESGGGEDLVLRMGVKSGGCSGMSYVMDFEQPSNIKKDDMVMEFDGFRLVCCSKSLLYLFGMQLDWSPALIGGGFQFHNPQAESSCGCGKSFSV